MTPINGSVKMATYEKGDNFIESEGAAAKIVQQPESAEGQKPQAPSFANTWLLEMFSQVIIVILIME
ncbi:MAG: hypothetical protein NTZ04_09710 [Chloroflexi bacterium]|nr:hypothetical protein [Chloroflexota bacterium]